MKKRKLQGVKRPPATDAETLVICHMFNLPSMTIKEFNSQYICIETLNNNIPQTKEQIKLADDYDNNNEANDLI